MKKNEKRNPEHAQTSIEFFARVPYEKPLKNKPTVAVIGRPGRPKQYVELTGAQMAFLIDKGGNTGTRLLETLESPDGWTPKPPKLIIVK